jgi:dephospho-CoA kinase
MLVCLTGVPGSGKTTILRQIRKSGYMVFETDKFIHSIYKFGQIGYNLISKHFGKEYVNKTSVNRKKLGRLVFSNKCELAKLNKLTIPLIKNKILSLKKIKNKLIFVELAIYLNYPSSFRSIFDKIVIIKGKQKLQISKQIVHNIKDIRLPEKVCKNAIIFNNTGRKTAIPIISARLISNILKNKK